MQWQLAARERCRGDRGAGALEFALITPAFLILAFLVVQAGLYWETQNVLNAIADDAGRDARATTSYPGVPVDQLPDEQQMTQVAGSTVAKLRDDPHGINGGNLARDVQLDSVDPATWAQIGVTVHGRTISILGFFELPERTATSSGPYEGFRPNTAAGG